MKIEGYQFKRHNDDEWIDEITFTTIPRYKESYLSGEEWRTGIRIDMKRKGKVLFTKRTNRMQSAVAYIPWGVAIAGEDPTDPEVVEEMSWEENSSYCAQPGCVCKATEFFAIKVLYNREGDRCSYQTKSWRGFCTDHVQRGNQDMEDNDDNYRRLEMPKTKQVLEIDIKDIKQVQ